MRMAQRLDPNRLQYTAGLCHRNAQHVLKLAWTTQPLTDFNASGVRWLDRYIETSRTTLTPELRSEFVQLMGCFYGTCLISDFGGSWSESGGVLGIRMDELGMTYPFTAVSNQLEHGPASSVIIAYNAAADYLHNAA